MKEVIRKSSTRTTIMNGSRRVKLTINRVDVWINDMYLMWLRGHTRKKKE